MKKTALILALVSSLVGSSTAALFNLQVSVVQTEIQNSVQAGGGLYTGPVRVGLIGTPGAITGSTTLADILNDFTEFGSNPTDFPGFLTNKTVTLDDTGNATPPNNTGQVYVVIGDSDLNRAVFTEPGWTLGTFQDLPTPTPSIDIALSGTTQIVGGTGALLNSSIQSPSGDALQLGAIPEPSTSILAALGVMGFVFRRRR